MASVEADMEALAHVPALASDYATFENVSTGSREAVRPLPSAVGCLALCSGASGRPPWCPEAADWTQACPMATCCQLGSACGMALRTRPHPRLFLCCCLTCVVQEPYRLKLRIVRHRLEQNMLLVNRALRRLSKKAGYGDEVGDEGVCAASCEGLLQDSCMLLRDSVRGWHSRSLLLGLRCGCDG